MMSKWKVGNFFIDTLNSFETGRTITQNRRLYVCEEILENEKFDHMSYGTIVLKDVQTKESIRIGDDDRYGRYPLVNWKLLGNVQTRLEEAENNAKTLRNLERLITFYTEFCPIEMD